MNEKKEAATLASDYLDNLIRTADKYEIEREKYVRICVMALLMTVDTIDFKTFRYKEGENG